MSILWSVIWGVMTLAIMYGTIKYYLPRLSSRVQVSTSGDQIDVGQSTEDQFVEEHALVPLDLSQYHSVLLQNRILTIGMLVICTGLAVWWGHVASEHAVSVISMLKLTLAMGVLTCIFITDMELMLIPNVCSLILVGGRFATIVCEFIFTREEALAWLLNSVVAFVVSLLLLLIMAKVTRGGLGMGDVKIFSSLGFLCGIHAVFFTLTLSFFLCALLSTVLLLTKKKQLKDALPMGPFIWLGYGITVVLSII